MIWDAPGNFAASTSTGPNLVIRWPRAIRLVIAQSSSNLFEFLHSWNYLFTIIYHNCKCQSLTWMFRILGMLRSFRLANLPGWLINTFCRSTIAAGNGHCQQCENQHGLHKCVYVALAVILSSSVYETVNADAFFIYNIHVHTLWKWLCSLQECNIIIVYMY